MPEKIIDLCSLQSHKDRLAFSVFLKLNENGDIISSRFEKTIVKSSARLTY
jgi:exoribonuclease R